MNNQVNGSDSAFLNDPWSGVRHDVVLMNFGGPTKSAEVVPFLRRLFEDPLILRIPFPEPFKTFFQRLLANFIVSRRAKKTDSQYSKIGYSPINRYTLAQAEKLQAILRKKRADTYVHVVNRYTPPFAEDVVKQLPKNPERLFLLTMYPHFSHATAGTSVRDFDQKWKAHAGDEIKGGVRVFSWWWHPLWLAYTSRELCRSIDEAVKAHPNEKISVIVSAHGLPVAYAARGDQYPHEIAAHFGELKKRARLWLDANHPKADCEFKLSFQSRVGPVEWIKPYTEDAIIEMGQRAGGLVMVPISFVSDHIETLYEMDVTYREEAQKSGFKGFYRVRLPNDDVLLAECLADVLIRQGF